ncbi:MAG: hypothetical protein QOF51_2777 [Chloroflexota bacterium]|nr:hypothetical protein [Chloroflexota bacterium]
MPNDPSLELTGEASPLDRWAAWLGTAIASGSLGLVAIADLGRFHLWLALLVLAVAVIGAGWLWRPPLRIRPRLDRRTSSAALLLLIGAALIAPGSENVVGPRDPAVYVATGFDIARFGSVVIPDPGLRLLDQTVDPSQVNAWIYVSAINGAQIRFPTQLFVHDLAAGAVEGGFLPVVPTWIALAASLGGLEPALHVAGVFGVLALAFAMLASSAAQAISARAEPIDELGADSAEKPRRREATTGPAEDEREVVLPPPFTGRGKSQGVHLPVWPIVGAILAVSFSQVWWAREPMAESALGAFAWLTAWAGTRWIGGGGSRWGGLAALGATAALFTRADGVLVAGALILLLVVCAAPGRSATVAILGPGLVAAGLHDALFARVYMGTTYGAFTFGRAVGGLAIVALAGMTIAVVAWLRRSGRGTEWHERLVPALRDPATHVGIGRRAVWAWRAALLLLLGIGSAAALSGLAPGVGREPTLGAASPLAWLPGYLPWPILGLAAAGLLMIGWNGTNRSMVPLLLIGGLPALLYLPDPLVTGDHPWMVRRLVPAVVPLIAILASTGAAALWRADPRWFGAVRPEELADRSARGLAPQAGILHDALGHVGPLAATALVSLGLALAIAHDGDFIRPRHAAGVVDGLQGLAAKLPADAVVIFPAGNAGIHLAMPLDAEFGRMAFAIPEAQLTPTIAVTLQRMDAAGHPVFWAMDAFAHLETPPGVVAQMLTIERIGWESADHGPKPPPLELTRIDDVVAVYRLSFSAPS